MHLHIHDLMKDAGGLAAGFGPLAFFGAWGTPAVLISLLNIVVFGLLRFYNIKLRSRERMETARLRLELEEARGAVL